MINKVSQATKSAIARKSAQSLPNNPSEKGYSAEEIKRRFYQPIIDAANSALAEIDRVVNEANISFGEIRQDLDNFIDTANIKEPFKLNLNSSNWNYNEDLKLYEVFITPEEHKIEDYREIGVDMFLIDGKGMYSQVNQFEIDLYGVIRCYHESNGAGYISVYIKREGLIEGKNIIDVNDVKGLAKVAKTNNFEDLDNLPDLGLAQYNELTIGKIISGEQIVGHSEKSDEALISTNATFSQSSGNAETANKAINDESGLNIANNYARTNGTYPTLSVGLAEKATMDKYGNDITKAYAKQDGTYSNMTVGFADNATNATMDKNGNDIAETYAKKNGSYTSMSVGEANNLKDYIFTTNSTGNILINGNVLQTEKVLWDKSQVDTSEVPTVGIFEIDLTEIVKPIVGHIRVYYTYDNKFSSIDFMAKGETVVTTHALLDPYRTTTSSGDQYTDWSLLLCSVANSQIWFEITNYLNSVCIEKVVQIL